MRWIHAAAAIGLTLLGTFSPAHAEGLAPANIPANARWLIHLDADAARAGKVWDLVQARLITPHQPNFDNMVRVIDTLTGMKFPTDLHDVTLFGTAFTGEDTCILIHAVVDQTKVTDFLKLDPEFNSTPYNDHDILTWRDKDHDRLLHGAFFGTERIIVSPNEKLVRAALDTMDAKAKSLNPAAGLAAPPLPPAPAIPPGTPPVPAPATPALKAAPVLYIAGEGLSDLQKIQNPASPILAQTDAAWLAVSQVDDNLVAHLWIKAKTEKTAEQVQDIARGVRALLALFAEAQHADLKTKAASAALENLVAIHNDRLVSVQLTVPLDIVKNLLQANHLGESRPASKEQEAGSK